MTEMHNIQIPPEGVYHELKLFFKKNHIKQTDIQRVLNYKSPQAVSNLFRTLDRYLNKHQAEALCKAYNFNFEFLTKGEGPLFQKQTMPECVTVIGSAKDQFYPYAFEVFRKVALSLQNRGVTSIIAELNHLATLLNFLENNGELSEEEIDLAIKHSKIIIDCIILDVEYKEELKAVYDDQNVR